MSNLQKLPLAQLIKTGAIKDRFAQLLGHRSNIFATSIINATKDNPQLQKAEPLSIIQCALVAASLNLEVDKNLGQAWIVPYGQKAQFQIGWKGWVQLALRSGQFSKINVQNVYEGQLKEFNPFTEEIELDHTAKTSDEVVGYFAYFKLVYGYTKSLYWSKEEVEKHGARFSKTFGSKYGVWKTDFDAMARKTVLKNILSNWAPLDVNMQHAAKSDSRVINDAQSMDVDTSDEIFDDAVEVEDTAVIAPNIEEKIDSNFDLPSETAKKAKATKQPNTDPLGAED